MPVNPTRGGAHPALTILLRAMRLHMEVRCLNVPAQSQTYWLRYRRPWTGGDNRGHSQIAPYQALVACTRRPSLLLVGDVTTDLVDGRTALVSPLRLPV